MNIEAVHQLNLWCETLDGRMAPVDPMGEMPPVTSHPYAVSRFPLEVRTEYYRRRESDGSYGGNDRILACNASANESLVLAMATGGREYWPRILARFWFHRPQRLVLSHAIVIASEACERCLNALAYEYGLPWGYREFSDEWEQCGTSCVMCRHD